MQVLAVRRDARGVELLDWRGFSGCEGLTCANQIPPTYCAPDAGPDAAGPADGLPTSDGLPRSDGLPTSDGGAGSSDAVVAVDGALPSDARAADAATRDAGGPADGLPRSDDAVVAVDGLLPSDATALADARGSADGPADLGVAALPLGADSDVGCLPGPAPDGGPAPTPTCGWNDDPRCETFESAADRQETCLCTGGYGLEARGLRFHFGRGALETTEAAGGIELAGGRAVATANGVPVPEVLATLDGVGLSGVIRIFELEENPVAPDDPDTYLTFSGAFELATDRIALERGLFRPSEAK